MSGVHMSCVEFKKKRCCLSLSLISMSMSLVDQKVKPIFHCKMGLCWVTNANKMSTNNMKYRGQCGNFAFGTQCNLYSTDSCWGFAMGVKQILTFLDTNMLVFPMQNFALGV